MTRIVGDSASNLRKSLIKKFLSKVFCCCNFLSFVFDITMTTSSLLIKLISSYYAFQRVLAVDIFWIHGVMFLVKWSQPYSGWAYSGLLMDRGGGSLKSVTHILQGVLLIKFNNLGLILGTNLEFYTSVAKGFILKFRKF